MHTFLDTNILYQKFSDTKYPVKIKGENIVSISALEFLKNIEKEHHNKAKYHIPVTKSMTHLHSLISYTKGMKSGHPFPSRFSDSIIFDFKQEFESYALFNNESITSVINNKWKELFYLSIDFIEKKAYKDIKQRFNFLLLAQLNCESLTALDIETSYGLLGRFLEKYSLKNDFRNSWNDMLILGKVINTGAKIISTDNLLNRFAANVYNANFKTNNDFLEIQFPKIPEDQVSSFSRLESKAYINRGWQFRINKGKTR